MWILGDAYRLGLTSRRDREIKNLEARASVWEARMIEANYSYCGTHWKAIVDKTGTADIYVCTRASGSQEIADWVKVGFGTWDGTNIESPVILPNEIYEGLDSGLRTAHGLTQKLPDYSTAIVCPKCQAVFVCHD